MAIIFSLIVIVVMRLISKKFILSTISSDLASSSGIDVEKINFIFLLLVALIVALGIKAVGTLLMGALVIIPAIASKNITGSMSQYTTISALFGLISLVLGVFLAGNFNFPPGPVVVLASTGIFILSLLLKRN